MAEVAPSIPNARIFPPNSNAKLRTTVPRRGGALRDLRAFAGFRAEDRRQRPSMPTMHLLPGIGLLLAFAAPLHAQQLLVTSRNGDAVLSFDASSGTFLGVFAAGAGLDNPVGLTFGPDGNLYVASALSHAVLRYHRTTGAILGSFASGGGLSDPRQLNFGPDGNLYVSEASTNSILRFDGASGAPLGTFASGGNLDGPTSFTFGPDGDLYVGSVLNDRVKRYDGRTGAYLGNFVSTNLDGPHDLAFGPDGELYVSNAFLPRIQRFDGVTGAFLGTFVLDSRLSFALGLSWDDEGHLLVVNQGRNEVLRYHGRTGAFLGAVMAPGAGGLDAPLFATFSPAPVFRVQPLFPSVAGLRNVVTISGATPGARIALGIGADRRIRRLPDCSGLLALTLPSSLVFTTLVADEAGRASFASVASASRAGQPYFLRAAEPATCRATEFVLGSL